jgi:3alpha(or 20beta)-hydroxysteroid dehydrogenase
MSTADDLSSRVVLISGAAGGQGSHEARAFVDRGAHVLLGDTRVDIVEELATTLGSRALAAKLDVRCERSWHQAVQDAERRFGPVTTLVNNAGIGSTAAIADERLETFRHVLDVNLLGTFLGMKVAARSMEQAGGGSIVNISSISGLGGFAGGGAYAASKWGVRGLTKSAAVDLAPLGIRVNSVHPGIVDTEMIHAAGHSNDEIVARNRSRLLIERIGAPEDIAAVVLFLASDRASYVTGSEFVVDGGWTTGKAGKLPT